ncbi:UNKNOWN [Stylonychia lemnae]|uniref:Uncharacterized protein n=1 Tax=Stylonychia lemnae TaxID=5949 RepID=A0A078A582_STYLE|nr:UNKNOWN [Stylonychia lemnae]|eukprot:CDW77039.1 UNKNOWN [Stylonychia lemnae]
MECNTFITQKFSNLRDLRLQKKMNGKSPIQPYQKQQQSQYLLKVQQQAKKLIYKQYSKAQIHQNSLASEVSHDFKDYDNSAQSNEISIQNQSIDRSPVFFIEDRSKPSKLQKLKPINSKNIRESQNFIHEKPAPKFKIDNTKKTLLIKRKDLLQINPVQNKQNLDMLNYQTRTRTFINQTSLTDSVEHKIQEQMHITFRRINKLLRNKMVNGNEYLKIIKLFEYEDIDRQLLDKDIFEMIMEKLIIKLQNKRSQVQRSNSIDIIRIGDNYFVNDSKNFFKQRNSEKKIFVKENQRQRKKIEFQTQQSRNQTFRNSCLTERRSDDLSQSTERVIRHLSQQKLTSTNILNLYRMRLRTRAIPNPDQSTLQSQFSQGSIKSQSKSICF